MHPKFVLFGAQEFHLIKIFFYFWPCPKISQKSWNTLIVCLFVFCLFVSPNRYDECIFTGLYKIWHVKYGALLIPYFVEVIRFDFKFLTNFKLCYITTISVTAILFHRLFICPCDSGWDYCQKGHHWTGKRLRSMHNMYKNMGSSNSSISTTNLETDLVICSSLAMR